MKPTTPSSLPETFFTAEAPPEPRAESAASLWSGVASHRLLLHPVLAKEASAAMSGVTTHAEGLRPVMELDPEYLSIAPPAAAYALATVTPLEPSTDRRERVVYRMQAAILRHLLGQSWIYDLVHPTLGIEPVGCAPEFWIESLTKDGFHRKKDGIVRQVREVLFQTMQASARAVVAPRTEGGLRELILGGLDRFPSTLTNRSRDGVTLWIYGGLDLVPKLGSESQGVVAGLTVGQTIVRSFDGNAHTVRVFLDQEVHDGAILGWTDHRGTARSAVEWNVRDLVSVSPIAGHSGHAAQLNLTFNVLPESLVALKF